MTLPASGAISLNQVAVELGVTATGINLNQSNVRTLAGVPSGAISMANLRGKSAADPVPNALDWANISGTGVASNSALTVGGTNVTITLRITLSSGSFSPVYESGSGSAGIDVGAVVNGVATSVASISSGGFNTTLDFTVPVGASVYFQAFLSFTDQLGGFAYGNGGCNVTITNQSSGATVIDTFSVSMSA